MPLIISENNLNWRETIDKIKIIVPFKSRVDTETSVFITSRYLKVTSTPLFWECFLASGVNVSECYTRKEDDHLSFELKKEEPIFWHKLEDENKNCKAFCKEWRERAFEEHKKKLEEIRELNATKKHGIHQASVRKQMELDKKERDAIEKEKRAENERVAAEIARIKKEQRRANEIAAKRIQLQEKSQEIPPTRKGGLITVSFTPRVFPTAARESQAAEEKEWLQKQAAASVSLEVDLSDLTPQERSPEWLKNKAEFLFNKEDYRGAINAYSLAIRMCPNLCSLYVGRSACHLRLRNLHKCIEDSSKALELLHPPVPSNAKDRLESHRVRGTAFQKLDLPVEGLMDFEAALKIDPTDEELKINAGLLRNLIQTSDD